MSLQYPVPTAINGAARSPSAAGQRDKSGTPCNSTSTAISGYTRTISMHGGFIPNLRSPVTVRLGAVALDGDVAQCSSCWCATVREARIRSLTALVRCSHLHAANGRTGRSRDGVTGASYPYESRLRAPKVVTSGAGNSRPLDNASGSCARCESDPCWHCGKWCGSAHGINREPVDGEGLCCTTRRDDLPTPG
jgi:hypothetical protein